MYLREVQHELLRITGSWYDCATICCTIKILSMRGQNNVFSSKDVKFGEHNTLEFNPKSLLFLLMKRD